MRLVSSLWSLLGFAGLWWPPAARRFRGLLWHCRTRRSSVGGRHWALRRKAVYQMAVPPDEGRCSSTGSCGMGRLWRSSPASCMHLYWCTATLYRKWGMWSGGIEHTRDRVMWNFATRARLSGVVVESHCQAIDPHGPQLFAHSSRNSVLHVPHSTIRVCAAPWCVDPHRAHGWVDFCHGGVHPLHHTFPHNH